MRIILVARRATVLYNLGPRQIEMLGLGYDAKPVDWSIKYQYEVDERDAPLFFHILQSVLILHGREMMNSAIEREWPNSLEQESIVMVRDMVRKDAC